MEPLRETFTILDKEFKIYNTIEEPLFLAKDVAEWIDYDKTSINKMLNTVDEDEKLNGTLFLSGQNRKVWFLTEAGVYEVLMQSRKPIAKQFKKEVKQLLKKLRLEQFIIDENINKENLNKLNKAVEELNRIKGLLVDTTGYSGNDYIRLDVIAKEWGDKEGININELALIELMRKHRWIDKEGNLYDKIKYGGKVICTKERYFLSPRGSELLWVHFLKESHSNLLEWSNNIKTEKPF